MSCNQQYRLGCHLLCTPCHTSMQILEVMHIRGRSWDPSVICCQLRTCVLRSAALQTTTSDAGLLHGRKRLGFA